MSHSLASIEQPLSTRCSRCEHNQTHGWTGPPIDKAHCRSCHRNWPMRNDECHCAGCCRHFKSVRAFDTHQVRDRCLDPTTLTTKDGHKTLVARDTPDGQMWVRHDDRKPPSASGSCASTTNRPMRTDRPDGPSCAPPAPEPGAISPAQPPHLDETAAAPAAYRGRTRRRALAR